MIQAQTQEKDKFKEGVKFDNDKLRLDLVSAVAMEELGKIYTYGAKKYEDHNWRKGIKWSRILGAIERHILAFKQGEDLDPESKLFHIAHAMWGCATLLEFYRTHPGLDDRYIDHRFMVIPQCQIVITELSRQKAREFIEKDKQLDLFDKPDITDIPTFC